MEPSHSSPLPSGTPDAASTLVHHFPTEVQEAFARFQAHHSPEDADIVVLAVVIDHIPENSAAANRTPADPNKLVDDLGFDSIAITEMVFFLEDLFRVRISNDEILRVRTVGDLRAFIREKLAALGPAPRA